MRMTSTIQIVQFLGAGIKHFGQAIYTDILHDCALIRTDAIHVQLLACQNLALVIDNTVSIVKIQIAAGLYQPRCRCRHLGLIVFNVIAVNCPVFTTITTKIHTVKSFPTAAVLLHQPFFNIDQNQIGIKIGIAVIDLPCREIQISQCFNPRTRIIYGLCRASSLMILV